MLNIKRWQILIDKVFVFLLNKENTMVNIHLEKKILKREIDRLEDEKVLQTIKSILSYAHESKEAWEDKAFELELKRRSAAFKSGKTKRYSWEAAKNVARKALNAKSKRA